MSYRLLAEFTAAAHVLFVLFAVLGGFLLLRWLRLAWLHVPALAWAALVELIGLTCPLTPLENWSRARAGLSGYGGGFLEHYALAVLYPAALTRELQIALGCGVLLLNVGIYLWVLRRRCAS